MSTDKKLRIGVLGAANIARNFTAALRGSATVDVCAVASRDAAKAAAFAAGARLGGAAFVDETAALVTLAGLYAVLMPTMVWLSNRFDGVSLPEAARV